MGAANPSRRSALGILATGPVAMLPAFAAMSCSTKAEAGISPGMASAIARYRKVDADCERFGRLVYDPAAARYKAAVAAVPHRETEGQAFVNTAMRPLRTDEEDTIKFARRIVNSRHAAFERERDPEMFDTMAELVNLADQRETEIAALGESHGLDRINALDERYGDMLVAAEDAVVTCAVASFDDLVAKADFLTQQGLWERESVGEQIAADIRRLAGIASVVAQRR